MKRILHLILEMSLGEREDTTDVNGPRAIIDNFISIQEDGSHVKYRSNEDPKKVECPFGLRADLFVVVLNRSDAATIMNQIDANLDQLPTLVGKMFSYSELGLD